MQKVNARQFVLVVLPLVMVMGLKSASGHCEIPCGIYNDEMRFDMIAEHIATVEKSMNMISELLKDEQVNHNQLVRWINNKENHADEIQNIICQYFMTQRVKPAEEESGVAYEAYIEQIALLHHMLVIAMKMKQTTDLTNAEKLRSLLKEFKAVYLSGAK